MSIRYRRAARGTRGLVTCLDYSPHGEENGQPLSRRQIVRHTLADNATEEGNARLVTYRATILLDQGKHFDGLVA